MGTVGTFHGPVATSDIAGIAQRTAVITTAVRFSFHKEFAVIRCFECDVWRAVTETNSGELLDIGFCHRRAPRVAEDIDGAAVTIVVAKRAGKSTAIGRSCVWPVTHRDEGCAKGIPKEQS
jgi:hypothetical protein